MTSMDRAGGPRGLDVVRAPAIAVEEHVAEARARRLGEIDELGRDRLGRPLEPGVLERGRGGFEVDQEMRPVRGPVGVAEVGDDAGGAEEIQVILGVIVHLRRREHLRDPADGVGVAQQRVEPDAVVDRGVLDLPVAPVVVAEGPALHLPLGGIGVVRQGPDGPGQGLGPERRAVHRAPLGRPEEIGHAAGDQVRRGLDLGGGEAPEAAQGVEGPDVAHGREEIRQGRGPRPRNRTGA